MLKLNEPYTRQGFIGFLNEFLPDFEKDIRKAPSDNLKAIETATYLGKSKKLNLQVFELTHKVNSGARIALATDGFRIMKQSASFRALVVFNSSDAKDWRLSLMTLTPEPNEKGKATVQYSNPRRYSFFLGSQAKINTPTKFLISKGQIIDFDDLKNRFSIEVVNKEFYNEISKAFTSLVNGKLKLPDRVDASKANLEFAVRMIGRIIFCWFLREKVSVAEVSLMPDDLLSLEAVTKTKDYYHKVLEPIFFEVLNQPTKSRNSDFTTSPFSSIPYLNGGLFSPQDDDFYERNKDDFQSRYHNTLLIPDEWFKDFFEILETYNFTIDENTSYDEELSIDPEMLGRIFENLLAEINPETGESARKNTGSYYTPRVIVNYMVDESLLLYLKNQTNIDEGKLKAIISYDLNDDTNNPVSNDEKEKIIDALEKVKILDPACGSGAFPMGALQKIVFILQQTDTDGQLWFKKQIKNTSPEIRRVVEREFEHRNFDYIRKLGIIRENIYGIDIQPIATEISRLRCFLTLIVDQTIEDEISNPIRGIEPLPNLEFKFVSANSLIGLAQSSKNVQTGLFEDTENINKLSQIRSLYFSATGDDRRELKSQFIETQNNMLNHLIFDHLPTELTQQLAIWKPFTHQSTPWFDPEWMFGIKNGFDIVIANPPYITIGGKEDSGIDINMKKNFLKNYISYEYKTNSFSLFIERSIQTINLNGCMTFIVPRTLLDNFHMQKLRRYILDNCKIDRLIELKYRIFDNAETGGNLILIVSKEENNSKRENNLISAVVVRNEEVINNISFYHILQKHFLDIQQNQFLITSDILFNLIKKIKNISTQLTEIAIIKNGVNTGNAANILLSTKKDSEMFRKILEGKDIDKYLIHWKNLWINYDPNLKKTIDLKSLKTRQSKIDYSLRDEEIFKQEKIIVRQTASEIIAAIDDKGFITRHSTHLIKAIDSRISSKYLLGVLNSKLITFYYQVIIPEVGKAFPEVKIVNLERLPIKIPTKKQRLELESLVNNILSLTKLNDYLLSSEKQADVKKYETKIDDFVFELYQLTPEEIKIVGKND